MMKRANSGINPDDLVDRISALPDSILSRILSSFPTKNVVATSILSKRWKSLWKAAINLDFNLDFCHKHCSKQCHKNCSSKERSVDEDIKFARFVNNVMLLHDGGFLNKFSLVWKPRCIPALVDFWIRAAIIRNVHELVLCLRNSNEPFEIHSSVFSCETLQYLELNGNVFISDATAVYLPMLKGLKLVSVYFQSELAFQRLISGCLTLIYLEIDMDIDEMMEYYQSIRDTCINIFTFKISSSSMRLLKLSVDSDSFDRYNDMPHCSLELETSSLEYLKLGGLVSRIIIRESLSSVFGADFNIDMCDQDFSESSVCNSFVEAVRAVDSAIAISLSRYALWALSHATIGLSTKFKRLIQLEAEADCCICSSLQDFIQSSDNLVYLAIHKAPLCVDEDDHDHPNWTTPVEVPRCLSNSLKTVIYYSYSGFKYEHEMIGYILQHGRVLEGMQVSCNDNKEEDEKFEMLQELCEFQRKSPACEVFFTEGFVWPKNWGTFPKRFAIVDTSIGDN